MIYHLFENIYLRIYCFSVKRTYTSNPLPGTITMEIITHSAKETITLGYQLGKLISKGMAIALNGTLASGKTTFVQGMARGLGVPDEYYITSPTYNIINEYPGRLKLYHMDLYRLEDDEELDYLGFDEIAVSDNSVLVVEWPDIIEKGRLSFDIEIRFSTDKAFNRRISLIAYGLEGVNLLKSFSV